MVGLGETKGEIDHRERSAKHLVNYWSFAHTPSPQQPARPLNVLGHVLTNRHHKMEATVKEHAS